MERIRLVGTVVVAAVLGALVGARAIPEAHGQSAAVTCESLVVPAYGRIAPEKLAADAAPGLAALQDFFARHPGAVPVYQAEFPITNGTVVFGYTTLVCVR